MAVITRDSTAFVFAGQGSQHEGMGADFYEKSPEARQVFDTLEEMQPGLKKLCFEAKIEKLSRTIVTQPTIFAVECAIAAALSGSGIDCSQVAGFSLGEIPAAVYAGLLGLREGFDFVRRRAAEMDKCANKNPYGKMAAVLRLDTEQVEKICEEIGLLTLANYNCPGQVVVSGGGQEIEKLQQKVKEQGGKVMTLAVSGAFHSPDMAPASQRVQEYLSGVEFCVPARELDSNVTADLYTRENAAELLSRQVDSPVRWEQTIREMNVRGIDCFVEIGPGKVLSGLIKRILPEAAVYNIDKYEDFESLIQ